MHDPNQTAAEINRDFILPEREFVSGIAPLNGYCFFRRDTLAQSAGGIAIVRDGHDASVNATCIAASADAPIKVGERCVIAFRNVREVWHRNEKVCVMKHDDILAVLEE